MVPPAGCRAEADGFAQTDGIIIDGSDDGNVIVDGDGRLVGQHDLTIGGDVGPCGHNLILCGGGEVAGGNGDVSARTGDRTANVGVGGGIFHLVFNVILGIDDAYARGCVVTDLRLGDLDGPVEGHGVDREAGVVGCRTGACAGRFGEEALVGDGDGIAVSAGGRGHERCRVLAVAAV